MEGLQLRSIKILSKGEPIEEVYRIIENNTRFPLELLGDIEAQLGGCLLGRDLTQAMADKYGIKVFSRRPRDDSRSVRGRDARKNPRDTGRRLSA